MTKTDFYPEWRRIRDLDLERLFAARTTMPLFGVSSMLRQLVPAGGDPDLDEESGFPELITLLRDEVLAEAEDLEAALGRRRRAHRGRAPRGGVPRRARGARRSGSRPRARR